MEATEVIEKKEIFRDSVATITKEGKRNFIHPKKPKGRFYNLRTLFSIFYLIVFFTLPFITYQGEPLLLLNIIERRFIIFGMIFWPQDFFIFGIAMVTFIVFIVLFTVVFGRVFCGWACPQTIFMEMVFRKIEYLVDGDASAQKRLKGMHWNSEKIRKRTVKFVVFFLISFLIASFFLAYLVGMDKLLMIFSEPGSNAGTLISLLSFTTIFFLVYWWFREQACIVVCPYGRLQGVLLDKNSIVVAYDHVRGEPRGKIGSQKNKKHDGHDCTTCSGGCKDITPRFAEFTVNSTGDCIDCGACVRVCPTGIDIRNGTQLECINCTACMDACDAIMVSINKPKGLIRYASENTITERKKLRITPRIKAYSAMLSLLIALLVFLLMSRSDLDVRLMRTAGMTYTNLPDGRIANLYSLKLSNKTHRDIAFNIKLENVNGEVYIVNSSRNPVVRKEAYRNLQFFIRLHRDDIKNWKTPVEIGLYSEGKKLKTITANFIGPEVYN